VALAESPLTAVWAFLRAPTVLRRAMLHWILPICLVSRDSEEARGAIVRVIRWESTSVRNCGEEKSCVDGEAHC
jgi:hypothetical protein